MAADLDARDDPAPTPTPTPTPTQGEGMAYATFADVAEIEATGYEPEQRYLYCWARLRDGRVVLWDFALDGTLGQDQRLRVVPGG